MDTLEAIFTRRSIRKFSDKAISDQEITQLLQAAMAAPSAGNAQPWRFIVVREQADFDAIAARHPYAQMAKQSSACIVVCADLSAEKYPGYWPQDCAAAIQNMLLAARAMGIGTVWTGVTPDAERSNAFKDYFALPEQAEVLGIVVCGYPDQPFTQRDTYKEEHVFYGKWGQKTS